MHTRPQPRAMYILVASALLLTYAAVFAGSAAVEAAEWSVVVSPRNSLEFMGLDGDRSILRVGTGGWGPGWSWVGMGSSAKAVDGVLDAEVPFKANGKRIDVRMKASKAGPRQIVFHYDLSAEEDVPLTMLIASLGVAGPLARGQLVLQHVDGEETTMNLPLGRGEKPATSKAVLKLAAAEPIEIAFDPPCAIAFDNDMRILLAKDVYPKGSRSQTITLTFPAEVRFLASQEDQDRLARELAGPDWFAFQPSDNLGPAVIDMNDWLDRPAGKHGGVRMVDDRFEFEDNTPVKFWGVNLSYGGACAPAKDVAEFTAARYAKYGINGVRLHKFTYPTNHMGIGDPGDATKMTPEGMDRLDYFFAEMKKRGIYPGWSHTFKFRVSAGNRDRLVAFDEIQQQLGGDTYALINYAEDVQDLMIEMVVNLLKHKNPYTGMTYAEDPALAFLEMQNEDDIFFYTTSGVFEKCPTYRKLLMKRFADWLTEKYGTQQKLAAAWPGALEGDETLADASIVPQANPWFFGSDHLPNQQGGQRQRLLDTAAFFHQVQNQFYEKFRKAIRGTGYKGPLVGSPWQAPSMLPHYYNLRSDYLVGYIDRHNYFGGGLFDSMLAKPGSGYFSTGLQQVVDRPFGLSEWISVYPSLYRAEGPAMIAVYGLGLQGWDASYEFQSQAAARMFNDRVGWFAWGVWEADTPTQIGQYPALARMVYRGDVKESEVISSRRVSLSELEQGEFSFSDRVQQQGDIKTFGGSVPAEALAAGRLVVEFTDDVQPSTFPDMEKYRQGDTIVSATEQLTWSKAGKGCFFVNTPGTKAVVGFAEGRTVKLGDVTIKVDSPYASIFLTAMEPDKTLADAQRALLTVVARGCNTGFRYFSVDNSVLENGTAPILLEPVRATIELARPPIGVVHVLDHDGRRTERTLTTDGGRFTIDGARDKAIYYEIVFGK
ncbi:MAG: hypothetical protein HQ581_21180 [Planctomycetes bacterium]|nr:hypothetical protein [Planctomycetota bacterium]